MDCIRHGRYAGPRGRRPAENLITCWVCGRPLAAGEDFGQWRIRAVRPSTLWDAELRCICPQHYDPGALQPPPPLPVWLRSVPSPAKKTDGGSGPALHRGEPDPGPPPPPEAEEAAPADSTALPRPPPAAKRAGQGTRPGKTAAAPNEQKTGRPLPRRCRGQAGDPPRRA